MPYTLKHAWLNIAQCWVKMYKPNNCVVLTQQLGYYPEGWVKHLTQPLGQNNPIPGFVHISTNTGWVVFNPAFFWVHPLFIEWKRAAWTFFTTYFVFHAKVFEVKMFSELNYLFLGCPNDHTLLGLIHLNTPYTHTHKIWVKYNPALGKIYFT